ncbi:MAG: hypothetical protein V4719_29100 [Planctomycetota bacterium]
MNNKKGDEPSLVHLSTGAHWTIVYHNLFQIDPQTATHFGTDNEGYTIWNRYFLQDLLHIHNTAKKLILDVGWYPEADPTGSFGLVVVRRVSDDRNLVPEDDWDHPLVDLETRSLDELLKQIEKIIHS